MTLPWHKDFRGKVLSGASKRTINCAAQSLRLAAAALHKSQSALGAYFRRLAARLDRAKTITRRFLQTSSSYLHHVNQGCGYKGQDYYEERYSQHVMHHLAKRAEKLGMQVVPAPQSI